jgi:hypothetical protein
MAEQGLTYYNEPPAVAEERARPAWYQTDAAKYTAAALAAAAAVGAIIVLTRAKPLAPPAPISAEEAAARAADEKRARDDQAAGTQAQPSFLAQNVPLYAGEWRQSPMREAFMIQGKTGALSVYRGRDPTDPQAVLVHTSGVTSIPEDKKSFSMVGWDGDVCTYVGTIESYGGASWCAKSRVADPKAYGEFSLHVTDEGRMVVRGANNPSAIVWQTPIVSNILMPSSAAAPNELRTGAWLRSENGRFILIQERDGSLEIYEGNNPEVPKANLKFMWKSTKRGDDGDYFTILTNDGILTTYKGKGRETSATNTVHWQSEPLPGLINASLQLTNTGTLAVMSPLGNKLLTERGRPAHRPAATPARGPPMPGTSPAMMTGGGPRGPSPAEIAKRQTVGVVVRSPAPAARRPAAAAAAPVAGRAPPMRGPSPAALAAMAARSGS